MTTKPAPSSSLHARIGKAFRTARLEANVTLREMASIIGCSINTVRWHEVGWRTLYSGQLVAVADMLEVPVEKLLGEKPKRLPMRDLAMAVDCLRSEQLVLVARYVERATAAKEAEPC